MSAPADPASPAFGGADLTNCEREPIHLAGAVQPHGALLVLRESDLAVVQASRNAAALLGCVHERLQGRALSVLGGDLAERVAHLRATAELAEPVALQCSVVDAAQSRRSFEGALHRHPGGGLVLEIEPCDRAAPGIPTPVELGPSQLSAALSSAVQRFSAAPTVGLLVDAVVQVFRELTGYDRVMVYKFDPDGHGQVIAEARHPRLESLLGHHYPATDIPQRARELYLRNRVRMLVNVDDTQSALEPALLPETQAPLDMSLCGLRSMSPIHLQYLRNMGVTATLTASLVHEGRLWGLVAAHHYAPRYLRYALRAASDLLAEVASTRIAAIENYAHAQVALMVRRLELRLVEATSTEGDWRQALFRNPRTLLQPLEATGAALFHDGELLTSGEVPSTPELRALGEWVRAQPRGDAPFACASVGQVNPALASLTPTASGVLAVRLSTDGADWLMWLRKEQLQSITWAGDPTKPMVDNNPLELSPRRSFAAWSEVVRGTAVPWSGTELALARAIGAALVDIIVQVQAVRLLIAEDQLAQIRATVAGSREAVLVADNDARLLFANATTASLLGAQPALGQPVAALFVQSALLAQAFDQLRAAPQSWRRELDLLRAGGATPAPVAVRAEIVHGRDRRALGWIVTLQDLSESRRADAARVQLESSLRQAARQPQREADEVISAILTHASLAAMDIADARGGPPIAPLLQELEASTRRAAALYSQIRSFNG
jgi:chemotaxis family two-component system sensor kinase Cph1